LLEREPNCPAYQPPAKNCTGLSNGILLSPQAPGRQTEIKTSRTLTYSFPHDITENTKFDFSCVGGCIKIEKVDFKCKDETRFLGTERVAELCGGKDRCVFKPDGKFFEVDHLGCTSVYAQVDVKCVGGSAIANHSEDVSETKTTDEDTSEQNKYCVASRGHSRCKNKGQSEKCKCVTIYRTLSKDAKQAILDKHNELRRKVAKGEERRNNQPKAADMREMVWNNELETVAQRWADQCSFSREKVRRKLDGTYVGQNFYINVDTKKLDEDAANKYAVNSVQLWYNQVSSGGFDPVNINPFKSTVRTSKYTQVVWGASEELGCAMVYFYYKKRRGRYGKIFVCNYATGGNRRGRQMYTKGEPCSKCPADYKCNDGLCAKPVL